MTPCLVSIPFSDIDDAPPITGYINAASPVFYHDVQVLLLATTNSYIVVVVNCLTGENYFDACTECPSYGMAVANFRSWVKQEWKIAWRKQLLAAGYAQGN